MLSLRSIVDSVIFGAAAVITGDFGVKGEAYTGQALGTYNGAILQTLDAVTWNPIRSKGGWVEGFVYLLPNLHSHTGIGIDETNPADITGIPFTDLTNLQPHDLDQSDLGVGQVIPRRLRGYLA